MADIRTKKLVEIIEPKKKSKNIQYANNINGNIVSIFKVERLINGNCARLVRIQNNKTLI